MKNSLPNDAANSAKEVADREELGKILAEDKWLLDQLHQGKFTEYEGEFIAIYNQRIVAHDSKMDKARDKAVRKLDGVPPPRESWSAMCIQSLRCLK